MGAINSVAGRSTTENVGGRLIRRGYASIEGRKIGFHVVIVCWVSRKIRIEGHLRCRCIGYNSEARNHNKVVVASSK